MVAGRIGKVVAGVMSTVEKYLNRRDWLRAKHGRIGASSPAKIAGHSMYGTAYSEWVHLTEPFRLEPEEPWLSRCERMEPWICSEFVLASGIQAACVPKYEIRTNPKLPPYLCYSPDAMTADGKPLELKTAIFNSGKIWKNEVPMQYLIQVQQQIAIEDVDEGFIAVAIDGPLEFQWHRVPRHQVWIDRILKRLDHFWNNYVVKRQPPPTDYHEATTKALLRKYPTANGSVVELPDEFEVLYDEMKSLTAAETAASRRKEEIKNAIRERMGDNRYGYLASGKGFQWSGENGSRRFTLTERCPEPSNSH
jgi:predicted phage-related endonuclease